MQYNIKAVLLQHEAKSRLLPWNIKPRKSLESVPFGLGGAVVLERVTVDSLLKISTGDVDLFKACRERKV